MYIFLFYLLKISIYKKFWFAIIQIFEKIEIIKKKLKIINFSL